MRMESSSIRRSTTNSWWKSVCRAQTGLRKSAATAGGAAGGLEQVKDDAPAVVVPRVHQGSSRVAATALLSS